MSIRLPTLETVSGEHNGTSEQQQTDSLRCSSETSHDTKSGVNERIQDIGNDNGPTLLELQLGVATNNLECLERKKTFHHKRKNRKKYVYNHKLSSSSKRTGHALGFPLQMPAMVSRLRGQLHQKYNINNDSLAESLRFSSGKPPLSATSSSIPGVMNRQSSLDNLNRKSRESTGRAFTSASIGESVSIHEAIQAAPAHDHACKSLSAVQVKSSLDFLELQAMENAAPSSDLYNSCQIRISEAVENIRQAIFSNWFNPEIQVSQREEVNNQNDRLIESDKFQQSNNSTEERVKVEPLLFSNIVHEMEDKLKEELNLNVKLEDNLKRVEKENVELKAKNERLEKKVTALTEDVEHVTIERKDNAKLLSSLRRHQMNAFDDFKTIEIKLFETSTSLEESSKEVCLLTDQVEAAKRIEAGLHEEVQDIMKRVHDLEVRLSDSELRSADILKEKKRLEKQCKKKDKIIEDLNLELYSLRRNLAEGK